MPVNIVNKCPDLGQKVIRCVSEYLPTLLVKKETKYDKGHIYYLVGIRDDSMNKDSCILFCTVGEMTVIGCDLNILSLESSDRFWASI